VFADAINKKNVLYLLKLGDSNPVPGGLPIVVGGKIIGGLGTSGATGDQDIQVGKAGLAALK
jgi:glc operon protein GlcG